MMKVENQEVEGEEAVEAEVAVVVTEETTEVVINMKVQKEVATEAVKEEEVAEVDLDHQLLISQPLDNEVYPHWKKHMNKRMLTEI